MLIDEDYSLHKPVLVEEVNRVFDLFAPLKYQVWEEEKKVIIDATVGGGGHAAEFIKNGRYVLGIDADGKMIEIAGKNLRKVVDDLCSNNSKLFACPTGNYDSFFKLVNENFINIDSVARDCGIESVDGILFDLGISSYHYLFDKGFSFQEPKSKLDMRLSDSQSVTAADLLNALPYRVLRDLFLVTLPFSEAKKLAKDTVDSRNIKKITSVGDFLQIVGGISTKNAFSKRKKISAPTLPFLALRIAVNSELDNLDAALKKAWNLLKAKGKLAVISFHSGEDKIVKDYFKSLEAEGKGKITDDLIRPSKDEVEKNSKARSAKMRVIKKVVSESP